MKWLQRIGLAGCLLIGIGQITWALPTDPATADIRPSAADRVLDCSPVQLAVKRYKAAQETGLATATSANASPNPNVNSLEQAASTAY